MEKLDYLMLMFMVIGISIIFQNKKREKLKHLLFSKVWIVNMIGIIIFILYELIIQPYFIKDNLINEEKKNRDDLKTAIVGGLFAHLIAIMAELKMTIAPFWITFIAIYFYNSG